MQRVAEVLSDGGAQSSVVNGVRIFKFVSDGEDFVVCSARGHVYAISDPFLERAVYPIFDVEWYPANLVEEKNTGASCVIEVIRKLAKGATKFVNACDFDPEGETIGSNILRYACGGKEREAFRAKFSTLTKADVVDAFKQAKPQLGLGPARAGRARHFIDFVWGVNLSRVLSQSALNSGRMYRTISIGRVQGPTLAFLVERELEIRKFTPSPFWKIRGTFEGNGMQFTAEYSKMRVASKSAAEKVRVACRNNDGIVTSVVRKVVQVSPPAPFSTGDLQREAYKAFRFSPSQTLQVAEKLYLKALVSYPRTGSQCLPPSIDFRTILQGLERDNRYSKMARGILGGALNPARGSKMDSAHPAIHPTGEEPHGCMEQREAAVLDLVVRRFLASFGPPARKEMVTVRVSVGDHDFVLYGWKTMYLGWIGQYGRFAGDRDKKVPSVAEGERFRVVRVEIEEKLRQGPSRYNQSSLLERMESENIGTKATRADIISTLVSRGYVEGSDMKVTDLGFAVFEAMEKYAPPILTTELTREIEEKIDKVEGGTMRDAELIRETVRLMADQLVGLNAKEDVVGRVIDAGLAATGGVSRVLGPCPLCKSGHLNIIRSKKTNKRFVGCSNYSLGCRASAPLPQRGTMKPTTKVCPNCFWPIVYRMGGRRRWRFCVNPTCPAKWQNESARVQAV